MKKWLLAAIIAILAMVMLTGCTEEPATDSNSTNLPPTAEPAPPTTENESVATQPAEAEHLHSIPVISQEHIDYLWNYAYVGSGGGIPLEEFILIFGEDCVRNIDSRPYAVVQKVDGTKLFVFFDWDFKNCLIQEVAPFVTKDAFEAFIAVEGVTIDDVNAFNPNFFWLQGNIPVGVYYVEKGTFAVEYVWSTGYVASVQYLTDEELQLRPEGSLPANIWMWYILPEDKQ